MDSTRTKFQEIIYGTGKSVHILGINTEKRIKDRICRTVKSIHGISDVELRKELCIVDDMCDRKTLKKYCDDLVEDKKIKYDESGKNIQWIPTTSKTSEELTDDLKKITKRITESASSIEETFKGHPHKFQTDLVDLLEHLSEELESYANHTMPNTSAIAMFRQTLMHEEYDRILSKVEKQYPELHDKIGSCLNFLYRKCIDLSHELAGQNYAYANLKKDKKGRADARKNTSESDKSFTSYYDDFREIRRIVDHGMESDKLEAMYDKLRERYPEKWSVFD